MSPPGERSLPLAKDGLGADTLGLGALIAVAALVYWVLLGGTDAGSVVGVLRAVNAAVAGTLIWIWLRWMPRDWDVIDLGALVALLCFLISAVTSIDPRSALDAATGAMAWTAAFFVARRVARHERARRFALWAMAITGLVAAVLFGFLWTATWLRWFSLTDASSPPLGLPLPTLVSRHVHVVALTVVMLAPAMLSLWRERLLRPVVVIVLLAAAYLALASGSRTVWTAAALASVVTAALWISRRGMPRLERRHLLVLVAVAGAALLALWAAGILPALVERVTTVRTLGARGEIWAGALQSWSRDPITGSGPGSFVEALPLSDYFQVNTFRPRHADNAVIQLLSEGGVVAAMGVLIIGSIVTWHLWRRGNLSSAWAVAFLAFASITDNPTDTATANALLIFWVALALPSLPRQVEVTRTRVLPAVTAIMFSVITVVYLAISAAGVAYDSAIGQATRGDLPSARDGLSLATTLDPGMALYQRELGVVEFAMGNNDAALQELRRAYELVPTDDVTGRALALVELAHGDGPQAVETIRHMVAMIPSGSDNLLTQAWVMRVAGVGSPEVPLIQALELDPLLTGAPSWELAFGDVATVPELMRAAHEASTSSEAASKRPSQRPMWLRGLAGLGEPTADEVAGATSVDLLMTSRAWLELLGCDVAEASRLIHGAEQDEGASGAYWLVRIAIASAGDGADGRIRNLASLAVPSFATRLGGVSASSPAVNPVQDRRLYGRISLAGLPNLPVLPSSEEAGAAWMLEPRATARIAAPDTALATCR